MSTGASVEEQLIRSRAVQAVIWGIPAVNYDLMYQAMRGAGGAANQIVYWSRLSTWRNQTLTPNPDSIYLMPFINTKNVGPMVLEIPPADGGTIVGSIDDSWQTALEDVGPAGADKGAGGKYLVLPPDFNGECAREYIALQASTYQSYALLRSILKDGSDESIAQAVAYGKRVRLYPLAQASNPPATAFIDVIDLVFDSAIPYDSRFFESLNRMVQAEPWLTRDKAMIDQLKSIGIVNGELFRPDKVMQQLLAEAARDAREVLNSWYESGFSPPYFAGTHWAVPIASNVIEGLQSNFAVPNDYPVDGRGVMYSIAFFSAKHLGSGQFYLLSIEDSDGEALDGARVYRLTVPANAPVRQYWSAAAYNRATHTLIRNQPRSSRSSQSLDLRKNANGSVDVYFAATAPPGNDSNWIPTSAGAFEVLFRLYGPEKALFDKTWTLPDITKV